MRRRPGRPESRSSRAADRSRAADSAPVLSIPGVATYEYFAERNVRRELAQRLSGSSRHHAAIRSAGVVGAAIASSAWRIITSRSRRRSTSAARSSGVFSGPKSASASGRSLGCIWASAATRIATSSRMMRAATARSTHPDRSSTAKRAVALGVAEQHRRRRDDDEDERHHQDADPEAARADVLEYSRVATSKAFAGSGQAAHLPLSSPTVRTKISCNDASRVSKRRIVR